MYLFFSKISLPRPVGNADFACCHYRNMKRVQEPLQHKLVPEFSLEFFPFYLGHSSYFHFHSFSSPFLVMIFTMLVHFTEECLSINISWPPGSHSFKSGSWAGENQSPWRDTEVSNSWNLYVVSMRTTAKLYFEQLPNIHRYLFSFLSMRPHVI